MDHGTRQLWEGFGRQFRGRGKPTFRGCRGTLYGAPQVIRGSTLESRASEADHRHHVRVGGANLRQAVLLGETHSVRTRCASGEAGVEDFDAAEQALVGGWSENARTQRVRPACERVWHEAQPPVLQYPLGRRTHAPQRGRPLLQEQRQHVAVARCDLHARNDLDPVAVAGCPFACFQRRGGLVVVGYRDYVQIGLELDEVDEVASAHQAVRGARVQMQVGAAHARV